jgi:hypothetical protein
MDADELALRLDVNLRSRGVCYPCLGEVAHILETDPKRRRGTSWFVTALWSEGLGESVAFAVAEASLRDLPGAAEAERDLLTRGPRSAIFRAVVERLARELAENTRRALDAAMN